MASSFTPLNDKDTKELRDELRLPITKALRYMIRNNDYYEEFAVIGYEVVDRYNPSNTASLIVSLDNGEKKRVLAPFFAHMQKNSFIDDMNTMGEE